MKTRPVLIAILLLSLLGSFNRAAAQGTAFTYQGELEDNGGPLNGSYDLTFTLYDGPGVLALQIGSPQALSAVSVNAGLFTVTLDFGSSAFTGPARWLGIAVHPHAGGATTTLSPRQQLTPAPYAITAENVAGQIPAGQLSGTLLSGQLAGTYSGAVTFNNAADVFTGNGAGLTGVNAATLGGYSYCSLPCYWKLTGNAGTTPGVNFLGTTDNQALELKANSSRGLRLEPNPDDAPNFIGGSVANSVASGIAGAAIGGGGANGYAESVPELGGYVDVERNQIGSDFGMIGGGGLNTISSNSHFSVLSGGILNLIATNSPESTIGGGFENTIQSNAAFATICGGIINSAGGIGAFVGGGGYDGINLGGNVANGAASTIGGGVGNFIPSSDHYSTIAGGCFNQLSYSPGGPNVYSFNSLGATIGGGIANTNEGEGSTIPGGGYNVAIGYYTFAAGQHANAMHDGSFVWSDYSSSTPFVTTGNNQFLIRAGGGVGIGKNNPSSALDVAGTIKASSSSGIGVSGSGTTGVYGTTTTGNGNSIYGETVNGYGIVGQKTGSGGGSALLARYGSDGNNAAYLGLPTGAAEFDGAVRVNGTLCTTSGGVTSCSDERFKEQIHTLSGALETVCKLRGVRFKWKTREFPERRFGEGLQIGFIAQEVRQAIPELVTQDREGFYAVDYSRLTPVLVEAVKAQETELRAQEARIVNLEKQIVGLQSAERQANADLQARLEALQKVVARLAEKSGTILTANHQAKSEE